MSQYPLSTSPHIQAPPSERAAKAAAVLAATPANGRQMRVATAVVYCEGNFGAIDGKTANGLVRHSERYAIRSVIDSEKAGLDAGSVLDGEPNGIPICRCARHGAQRHDVALDNRRAKANREVTWGCKSPGGLGGRNS